MTDIDSLTKSRENDDILLLKKKQTLKEILSFTKMNLEAYDFYIQKINNAGWLSTDTKTMALTIVESLKDYSETITIIIQYRKDILDNEFRKIELSQLEDFYKSLYGSMFALICVITSIMTESVNYSKTSVLAGIINQGYQFAQNLDSYTDTLDIMTNPKELELFENAEIESMKYESKINCNNN